MRYILTSIIVSLLSLSLSAQEEIRTSKTKEKSGLSSLFQGKKSIFSEMGFSANLLLSDLSNQVTGLGIGNQYSLGLNFNIEGKRGFKTMIQSIKAKENNFRNSKVDSSGSTYYRSFEQEWSFLAFGLESRDSNRLVNWYWDALLGYALGKKSRIQTQEDDISSVVQNSEEPTRSFLYVSFGAGVRKNLNPKWTLSGNFRTYAILGSIYGDSLKSKSLILLPMMANLGLEYNF